MAVWLGDELRVLGRWRRREGGVEGERVGPGGGRAEVADVSRWNRRMEGEGG